MRCMRMKVLMNMTGCVGDDGDVLLNESNNSTLPVGNATIFVSKQKKKEGEKREHQYQYAWIIGGTQCALGEACRVGSKMRQTRRFGDCEHAHMQTQSRRKLNETEKPMLKEWQQDFSKTRQPRYQLHTDANKAKREMLIALNER